MELTTLTIGQCQSGLVKKAFSSKELIEAHLARIAVLEPKIKAFLSINPQVLNQATQADEIMSIEACKAKPLLGIPVAIKDNFNTIGLETTASSLILKNYMSVYDATVVSRLKEAGAIILGKTNMDSFAHGSSTETSDFQTTSNPWDITKLPGGSSGGSAAAVAASETIFAIGSETAGSIRGPASWCGVVGLKPTYGRVSRYGVIAMASSTDTPGPMTKNVYDARIVYSLIAGHDIYDATTSTNSVASPFVNFDLKDIKVGVPNEYFLSDAQAGINETVKKAIKVFEKLGAKIVELSLFDPKYAISVYTILQRSEVSSNLARFDGIRFGQSRDKFNAENMRRIMLGTYTLSSGYYDAYYKKAQQVRTLIVDDFNKAFKKVDLIIGPTLPSVALAKGATEGQSMFGELADILVEPSSIAGLPGVNIPCGFVQNLPVGMQLIGPMWSEQMLFNVAQSFENHTEWHKQKPNI